MMRAEAVDHRLPPGAAHRAAVGFQPIHVTVARAQVAIGQTFHGPSGAVGERP